MFSHLMWWIKGFVTVELVAVLSKIQMYRYILILNIRSGFNIRFRQDRYTRTSCPFSLRLPTYF